MYGTLAKNTVSVEDCLKAVEEQTASDRDDIVFVDGSWFTSGDRDARQEFEAGPRIRGAKFIDAKDVSASQGLFPEKNPKGLPMMLPPKELFAATMDEFGIRNSHHVSACQRWRYG